MELREAKGRRRNRAKYKLYKLLDESGAWAHYPVCEFKHRNLYNKQNYIIKGRIIGEMIEGNYKLFEILTADGKRWHKHRMLDGVKIIRAGTVDGKEFDVDSAGDPKHD